MEFTRYFQAYEDYFWQPERHQDDFGEPAFVYEIPNGGTIAYANYIGQIIQPLATESLPPFGSLLLAIAATNYDPHSALEDIKGILKSKEVTRSFPNANLYNVEAAYVFLNKLASLPAEYKTSSKRIVLFQTIFKECHNRISGDTAKHIANEFEHKKNALFTEQELLPFNNSNFLKDIKTLALLNNHFPLVQSIIKAMENLPDIEDIQEQLHDGLTEQNITSDQPKDFVDQLIENDKTFHVGSLMKRLWSGLKIPLHHNQPSNQPLGGIADITNKGDFDKLLISEFANDDLVFMSRIANNEALYIEREIPPEEDKFTRDIVIDCSLKNWGNPKIIAFATALAIAKHPKTDIECKLYVVGAICEEVQHSTIHHVIDGLALLSGKIDCSGGLSQYFESNALSKAEKETFLIISEDSYSSTAFQKVLHENFDNLHYIITTSVSGEVSFYKIANRGRKLIQKMTLPLEELWRRNKKQYPKVAESVPVNSIPILYPLERNYKDVFHYENVYYAYSNGNLFQFSGQNTEKGLLKIKADIPFKKGRYGLYCTDNGERILVNWNDYEQTVSYYNVERGILLKHHNPFTEQMATIIPFTMKNSICFTDNIGYWIIDDDGKAAPINNREVRRAYIDYAHNLENFIRRFSSSKTKFNIVRKLNSVWLSGDQEIEINDFALIYDKFRINYYNIYADLEQMDTLVNLVYKRHGSNRLATIKVVKEQLNLSLKEAQEAVEKEMSVLLTNAKIDDAEKIKIGIEETGAVCFIETTMAKSEDGSTIVLRDGILELESSDKSIPRIYIPFVSNALTAMATEEEFAGNVYFWPENSLLNVIAPSDFHKKYIKPFVKTIQDYEVDA